VRLTDCRQRSARSRSSAQVRTAAQGALENHVNHKDDGIKLRPEQSCRELGPRPTPEEIS
jgi:hypothetical protein